METRLYARTAFCGILFLFFFQLLSDFVEAVYAFGLHSTRLVVETGTIFFLFSPVLLVFFRRGLPGWVLVLIGEVMLLCRALEPMFATRGRMYISGIGVACFLLLFPSLFRTRDQEGRSLTVCRRLTNCGVASAGMGMAVALLLSVLFRTLNSGLDISTWSWFQSIGWGLALIGGFLVLGLLKPRGSEENARPTHSGVARVPGFCLGMMSAFVLIYFAFMSPNVIARWTEAGYAYVVSLLVISICAFTIHIHGLSPLDKLWREGASGLLLRRRTILGWNLLFIVSMVTTIYTHQVALPDDPAVYPLYAPPVGFLAHVSLALMLISFPIILLDFTLFAHEINDAKPPFRVLAGSFSLASLFLVLMIFAHIFTTVYDYVPVIGPYFRDRFWCVYLVAGLGLGIPVLLIRKETFALSEAWKGKVGSILTVVLGLIAIAAAFLTAARPVAPAAPKKDLKVLTYNIQQGYSADGVRSFDEQLAVLRKADPDVIGLQESDTNRIAGGNCDVVRYYADKLNMYSYYGPSPVTGTFGVALLSKYPIQDPRTFFMYSHSPGRRRKEQTAAVRAEIFVGGKTFTVVVTHLGNRGSAIQQQAILESVHGRENVIAMGDFNSRPGEDAYTLATGTLDDSWVLAGGGNVQDREVEDRRRIDHIFVSRGTTVKDSRFLVGPQSDHPALMTEISW